MNETKTAELMLFMTELIHNAGKVVCMDSGFALPLILLPCTRGVSMDSPSSRSEESIDQSMCQAKLWNLSSWTES